MQPAQSAMERSEEELFIRPKMSPNFPIRYINEISPISPLMLFVTNIII